MLDRRQIFIDNDGESFFVWGARQSGKSTLLQQLYPNSLVFDLLLSDEYRRYLNNPELFREKILLENPQQAIIVDEIQKLPILLDEVHWLIEKKGYQFILSGSSPRKIIKQGANLLGGRAIRYNLYPLSYSEIPDFNLLHALNFGLLPKHYLKANPAKLLEAYIHNYLEDEIVSETKIRNLDIFSRFLTKAALSNGEMINYTNIATDCGISSNSIKEYFQILEDTLIGNYVQPFQKKPKRRVVSTPKFYFFDIGVVNQLLNRRNIQPGSYDYGAAFEHFIYHELRCYSHYSGKHFAITFWRTSSQLEVDFILGDHEVAIEVKSTDTVSPKHAKNLIAFEEEYTCKAKYVVSHDKINRVHANEILMLHWQSFLDKLWRAEVI
jgi:uncharacterized protein